MAHPSYKGPREPMHMRLTPEDKLLFKTRAAAAGMEYADFVMALVRHCPVDEEGRPTWLPLEQDAGAQLKLTA